MIEKINNYKCRLLLTTALTATVFLGMADIAGAVTVNISGKNYYDRITGSDTYNFQNGTWNSNVDWANSVSGLDNEDGNTAENIAYSKVFPSGIYQKNSGGITIEQRESTPPVFNFTGSNSVIWDYSAYVPGLKDGASFVLSNGERVYNIQIGGNISISGGIFQGPVDIRKGNIQDIFTTIDNSGIEPKKIRYSVLSQGHINISGGAFYFNGGSSQIMMYGNNTGDVNLSGGQWFVGYTNASTTQSGGSADLFVSSGIGTSNSVNVLGGQYHIADGRTMTLDGYSGKLEAPSSTFSIDGSGTLALNFKTFTINSAMTWETGTLSQNGGVLNIVAPVTLNKFEMFGTATVLKLNSVLSIKQDFNIQGTLTGQGELRLSETANASFGYLLNFGTVTLDRGTLTLASGLPTEDNISLSVLNGNNGTININGRSKIETLNMGNATLNLNEELIVSVLNFDNGKIVFKRSDKPLTLIASSTIYNTTNIVTDSAVVSGATAGILTIKDGMTLTFADKAGTTEKFNSKNLTVSVENGASAVFNSADVSFNTLQMTKGSATVNSGQLTLQDLIFGDRITGSGTFTIANGATTNVQDELIATIGSTVTVNGTLNVNTLTMNGTSSDWSTLTGSGIVNMLSVANFNGVISGLNTLNVTGTSSTPAVANFNGLSGKNDTVGTLNVTDGTVNINNGTLTLDALLLNNGTVNLVNENVVLALKGSPTSGSGTNTISGKGTLELLGNTDISFGGGSSGSVGYLGGLKIGAGTATITASTVLGSVTFSSATQEGTLQINNGVALTLGDQGGLACTRANNCNILSGAANIIQGEGTLNLINGSGSVFGGKVDLGSLVFGGTGTMTFNYTGESRVGTLDMKTGGSIAVNNGTLTITNNFGNANTTVYGTGTLFLNSGTFKTGVAPQSLTKLKIGTGTVNIGDGSTIGSLTFNTNTGGVANLTGTTTITNNITIGSGNTVSGSTLNLSGGAASGQFNSVLTGLNKLQVQNGAAAFINTTTGIGAGGVDLSGNGSRVIIASGQTLTLNQGTIGSSVDGSVITGDGTLALSQGTNVYALLKELNNLNVAMSSVLHGTSSIKNNVSIASGATLTFGGGSIGNQAQINGTGSLLVAENASVGTVLFNGTGGKLEINAGKTISVNNGITVTAGNKLAGTGTLFLAGASNGTFAMNSGDAFAGTLKIGQGTASIASNVNISGSIIFNSAAGGTLNIGDGYMLSIGTIKTDGQNKITGNGTLNLTGSGSEFKAVIDNLGRLNVTGGGAGFYNNVNIGTLAFNNGGALTLMPGMTMTVANMTQAGSGIGTVSGQGNFQSGAGTVSFSTGNNYLASATVGTGTMNFVGNSQIGSLRYASVDGTINIADNITVSVGSDFSGIGKLTGSATANLYLQGRANATFDKANGYAGTIRADNGNLNFLSDTDFASLTLDSASAVFQRQSAIDNILISSGSAEFKQNADIGALTLGSGTIRFRDTAALGTATIGSGTVFFSKNASLSGGGSIGANGTLNVDVNTLTVSSGNLVFNDTSRFALRISRDATDQLGNVNSTGYGKLVLSSGTLDIRSNVTLGLTIDYGLNTAESGSVFQLVEGVKTGSFVFENNRYSLTEESCSGSAGICYRLLQTSTGGEVAEQEQGNTNQVNTATAFLDSELFDYGTKIFDVAEHLDALSQAPGQSRAYLNALTALAPDVTGAMTRQPINMQSKISNTIGARLNGLMGSMGSSSKTYKDIQKMYGRSGGSPYRSRYMRSEDYYRRAGYYDTDDEPVTKRRPAYKRNVEPNSPEAVETVSERKQWARRQTSYTQPKEFGLWAQAFYNKSEYLSTNKPDGFAGDTSGFAVGGDVELFDVFAVGLGYASTTTTIDTLQRSTDVTGDSFFLYGMYKPSDWFVSSVLNMTSMTYEESKDLSGMTIGDNYDGSSFGASFMVGKDLKTWTPAVGLRYVSAERDAHKDEIGQDISAVSTSVLTAVVEGRWNRDFAKTNNGYWHSELSAALTYDLTASGEDAVVNLPNGSIYTVKGDDFDPIGVELGGSLAYILGEHTDISAGYNLEWRPDYMAHTLTATFRYSF